MNRSSFQRTKRHSRLRLMIERLESRRLMAGLNVLVFSDNDGTRSFDNLVDTPAANRLVYVDLNRNGRFEDSEPLSVSGADGLAKFPDLAAGDYLVGLAGHNLAQVQTTSVTSDALARPIAAVETQRLISSSDLNHVWSVSPTGQVTRVGVFDPIGATLDLGGPLISSTPGRRYDAGEVVAWALVDRGNPRPTLLRLDLAAGTVRTLPVENLPVDSQLVGVAAMGDRLVLKLDSPQQSYVGIVHVTDAAVTVDNRIAVPRGSLVSSLVPDRLAVLGDVSGGSVSSVRIAGDTAMIETVATDRPLDSIHFSPDGRLLFAVHAAGGVEVFSTANGLHPVAYLAEAGGPVAISRADGRLVTGNALQASELIVWDSSTWRPIGRIALTTQSDPLRSLAVDEFGQRLLAATATSIFGAGLANPAPLGVTVASGNGATQASLGVRVVEQPNPLPSRLEIGKSFDEDDQLAIDLASIPMLAALGTANLMFAPSVSPRTGTMQVSPSGRFSYRPAADASGTQTAELRLFDGINATTLVLSLNVVPVNDPPTAFTIDISSASPISEASPPGTTVGYTTVFDVDTDARYLITTDDPRFVVVDGQLQRSEVGALDFESEPIIELNITAIDAANRDFIVTQQLSIPIADSNDGPTSFGFSFESLVSENSGDFQIGTFSIDDPDGHGDYLIALSDPRFEVVDGQLRVKAGEFLDYELEPQIELGVTISDPDAEINAAPVTGTINIDVQDMNDAPDGLWVDPASVMPRQPGAYVGLIYVNDQDFYGDYTYTVSDPRFVVEGDSLRLADGVQVDRSAATTIPIVVTATDSDGHSISGTVSVQVINDAPFQNPGDPLDVDNDGQVYPRDVLILIDLLNRKGPHLIEPLNGSGEGDNPSQDIYIDVNGDGYFSPLDALILINHLNKRGSALGSEGEAAPLVDIQRETNPLSKPSGLTTVVDLSQASSGENSAACGPYQTQSLEPAAEVELDYLASVDDRRALARQLDSELESLLEQLSRERLR